MHCTLVSALVLVFNAAAPAHGQYTSAPTIESGSDGGIVISVSEESGVRIRAFDLASGEETVSARQVATVNDVATAISKAIADAVTEATVNAKRLIEAAVNPLADQNAVMDRRVLAAEKSLAQSKAEAVALRADLVRTEKLLAELTEQVAKSHANDKKGCSALQDVENGRIVGHAVTAGSIALIECDKDFVIVDANGKKSDRQTAIAICHTTPAGGDSLGWSTEAKSTCAAPSTTTTTTYSSTTVTTTTESPCSTNFGGETFKPTEIGGRNFVQVARIEAANRNHITRDASAGKLSDRDINTIRSKGTGIMYLECGDDITAFINEKDTDFNAVAYGSSMLNTCSKSYDGRYSVATNTWDQHQAIDCWAMGLQIMYSHRNVNGCNAVKEGGGQNQAGKLFVECPRD